MIYLLDANVFMEAAQLYYSFDLTPGFWNWLEGPLLRGRVASIEAVRAEIVRGEGDLVTWAAGMPSGFWQADTADSIANARTLVQWARDPARPCNEAAVAEFASSADLRLIAIAMAIRGAVVTREVSAPRAKKRVKIPDVCAAFGVTSVTPFEAYRALGMRL